MERDKKLTPALKKAQEEGIDLTLLYERLSWTPTERIEKHLRMLEFANELRKAGQKNVANLKVTRLEHTVSDRSSVAPPIFKALNDLFLSTLAEVWHNKQST